MTHADALACLKITFYAPGHFIRGRYEQNLWCCPQFARIWVFKTLNMSEMCPTSADLPSSLMMSHIWSARVRVIHISTGKLLPFQEKKRSTGFYLHRMHECTRQKRCTYQNAWINPISNNFPKLTFYLTFATLYLVYYWNDESAMTRFNSKDDA